MSATPHPDSEPRPFRYKVGGMDCASCAKTIEQGVKDLAGVREVRVNFTTETLEGRGDVAAEAVRQRVEALGYRIAEAEAAAPSPEAPQGPKGFLAFLWRQRSLRLALILGLAALATVPLSLSADVSAAAAADAVRWIVIAIVGYPIARRGIGSLIYARRITIDLLMTTATIGAAAIGASGEAVTVVLLFTLGEALEAYSAARSRASLGSLLRLKPAHATVVREHGGRRNVREHGGRPADGADAGHAAHEHRNSRHAADDCCGAEHAADGCGDSEHAADGCGDSEHAADGCGDSEHAADGCGDSEHAADGCGDSGHAADDCGGADPHRHYETRPVALLVPGDRVLVRPGERIPADGRIVEGASAVDNSAITGESVPVTRTVGDEVFAGTINGDGTLEIEVTRRADDFTISQIARLVEQAQAQRSPTERFVDRFAKWYTPAVVALAAAVAVVPPLAFGQPFLATADGTPGWLYRGLALLIIACPCALIISIPVTVVSALTRLANLGVLVKGGARLDELARTRVFAFDKTGTLTHGRPVVSGIRSLDCVHAEAHLGKCDPCDEIVALAASVERGSAHPFAHAVLAEASDRGLAHRYAHATNIASHAGRGVTGMLNGRRVTVGNAALFGGSRRAAALVAENGSAASSVMLVGEDGDVRGYIEVQDRARPSTAAALRELKALDPSYRFVMLTGDRPGAADSLGRDLPEIDEIHPELLPEQKLGTVRAIEAERGAVAMVGDGVNDTPALAAARLGIAMGGAGSPQAMEVADVVLMQDDLSHLPQAVRISRKTQRLIRENIALSLGLKLAFLALAIPGIATLWMAVVADVGATVLVTLNGMRMLRAR